MITVKTIPQVATTLLSLARIHMADPEIIINQTMA
jgi:hypothetical protein